MKIVKEAESFNPAPIIGIIREFLQEHPFENEAHDTFEDFEEYVAYELFDKEVKELTSEESYAISDVWEDLQDELSKEYPIENEENREDDLDEKLNESGKMIQTLLTVADQEALIEKAYNASDDKKETMIKIFADNSFDEDDVNDFIYLLEYGDSKAYFYLDTLVRDRIIDAIIEVLGEVDLNEDYKSAKRIVADIYDKSGNILETRYFSNRKQLDSFVDNLNNLIDMTADNNVLFKDSKGNMRICDIWRITVDDLITEEAKKKKALGAFVKLDAGDVEEGNKFFNKAVAGTESESGCNMSEDLKTINIRDELNKLDTIDYNDLVNMYDCLKLSDFEKTQLAQLLFNHDNENAIKFISDRYYKENICEQVEDEYSDAPNTLLSKRDRLSKRLSEIDRERAKIEKTIDYQQDHNYSVIDFDLMDRLDELNMEAEIINKKLEEI